MIHVRRAGTLDQMAIADLLNEVIAAGGTTAMTHPVSRDQIAEWMTRPRAIWHVAEDDEGNLLGVQWVDPSPRGAEIAEISTFARIGRTGIGVGSALFEATKTAARAEGFAWVNAEIRAGNAGGRAYYQSRGFEDYGWIEGKRLPDGTIVDKVLKRFDL